jgi:predicted DNA-binding transcriptional regulator YafY
LLLLQARGQVTAPEVAEELEVSERTARRDLEALGLAGLPVYSQAGRGGGWRLAGGGRIDLSGLTEAETRALFLMAGPAAVTPEVKAALRKVVRALPEAFREQAQAASKAVLVDRAGWGRTATGTPAAPVHLDGLQQAVISGTQVVLGYRARDHRDTTRIVHPLGLAAKGSSWYLVARTEAGMRTFRVDRVTSLEVTDRPVERPDGFDLAEAWQMVTEEVDRRRAPLVAQASADPSAVPALRWLFDTRLQIGPIDAAGRVSLQLRGVSAFELAAEIAGFAAVVEVTDPPEVRAELARIGTELVSRYV